MFTTSLLYLSLSLSSSLLSHFFVFDFTSSNPKKRLPFVCFYDSKILSTSSSIAKAWSIGEEADEDDDDGPKRLLLSALEEP